MLIRRDGSRALPILVLAVLMISLTVFSPDLLAHNGTVMGGFAKTSPSIDGILSTGEWSSAGSSTFTVGNFVGTVYVMNDQTNLYVGFSINDASAGRRSISLYFDNDHDGVWGDRSLGEDRWIYGNGTFLDLFVNYSGTYLDATNGGMADGAGAGAATINGTVYEFSYPLCSGDLHNFCLSAGSTVGFAFGYFDNSFGGDWPSSVSPGASASAWADITIKSAEAGGPNGNGLAGPFLFGGVAVVAICLAGAVIYLRGKENPPAFLASLSSRLRRKKPPSPSTVSAPPPFNPPIQTGTPLGGQPPADATLPKGIPSTSTAQASSLPTSQPPKPQKAEIPKTLLPPGIQERRLPLALTGGGLVLIILSVWRLLGADIPLFAGLLAPGVLLFIIGARLLLPRAAPPPPPVVVIAKRFCMHCGFDMSPQDAYCARCHRQPPSGVDTKVCPNCGAVIPTLAKFCRDCGAGQPAG